MATFRTMAAVVLCAGSAVLATAARACDERYPATCKSATAPAAAAAKATAKPLQIASRRGRAARIARSARGASVAKAARIEDAAKGRRKHAAHKVKARRWAARARHAKVAAEPPDEAEIVRPASAETARSTDAKPVAAARPRAVPARAVAGGGPDSGFAALWMERGAAVSDAANVAQPPPAPTAIGATTGSAGYGAAPGNLVRIASQSEVNEIDLAAGSAPADVSWMRRLFIALGGLLAVGSAVRLFM